VSRLRIMGHYLVPFSKTGMTRMMIKNEEIIINIRYELKYPALLGIEGKVNCYLPTASTN
jgi:hypothetical protein